MIGKFFLAKGAKNFAHAIANAPTPTLAASYFFVLQPRNQVLPAYLAWFLNQESTLRAVSRSATSGTPMPVVRRADLEALEITVPPLPMQNAIVQLDNLRREEHDLLCDLVHRRNVLVSAVCASATHGGGNGVPPSTEARGNGGRRAVGAA